MKYYASTDIYAYHAIYPFCRADIIVKSKSKRKKIIIRLYKKDTQQYVFSDFNFKSLISAVKSGFWRQIEESEAALLS